MQSMKKTAVLLTVITIVSKILGFTREIVLAYFYGTSGITDAYLVSLTIPGVIFAFVGVAIATSFIPLYSNIKKDEGLDSGNRYINNLISLIMIISTLIIIVVLNFTDGIVKVFASGFEGETLEMSILFTRVFIIGIYFSGLIHIFTGFLHVNNNFIIPALTGVPFNLTIILAIILSSKFNSTLLIIGTLIAKIIELFMLVPFIYRHKYKYKLGWNLKDKHLKQMIFLALPAIIGISVNQINTLIDRTLASQIAIGGISALNYSNRLNSFVQGIFVMSLATVMYPMISKMAADGNLDGLKKSISEAISSISLLVVPTTVGAMVFSQPVVSLLFGRGAFDSQAISMTAYALFFYSLGMIGFGLREVLSRAFYSLQDTKTPMINAAIGMVINIGLNVILSKYMGIGGLALATSISAIFTTVLMFISLRKKIGPFGMKQISISFVKILFASLVMGLIAKLSFNYLTSNILSQNLSLIISIGIGVLTYFAIIYFMKIDDVDVIVNVVKKKLTRSKATV